MAIEVGVLEDNVRGLPSQFERHLLQISAAACKINLPTSVEPVKATLSTSGCAANGARGLADTPSRCSALLQASLPRGKLTEPQAPRAASAPPA